MAITVEELHAEKITVVVSQFCGLAAKALRVVSEDTPARVIAALSEEDRATLAGSILELHNEAALAMDALYPKSFSPPPGPARSPTGRPRNLGEVLRQGGCDAGCGTKG